MKESMELFESLFESKEKFMKDPEVVELISKLKSKVKELESTTFSKDEIMSEEFERMCEMYYQQLRESDPDDFDVFDVLWFD
jgi:hypothetical protein